MVEMDFTLHRSVASSSTPASRAFSFFFGHYLTM
jgi:hypothetical protein